jgi:hypothetical protein
LVVILEEMGYDLFPPLHPLDGSAPPLRHDDYEVVMEVVGERKL